MSRRKFTYDHWDYDCNGSAYIIARSECLKRDDVPRYIIEADHLHEDCLNPDKGAHLSVADVREGWCKYQCRTDWENGDGKPQGGYFVEERAHSEGMYYHYWQGGVNYRKKSPGWFPVWIVRIGEWY